MDPPHPVHPLMAAAAWALPAAALSGPCLPAAALVAALGVWACVATRWRARHAGLLALPVVLCAAPARRVDPPRLPPGPLEIAGEVEDVARAPQTGQLHVRLVGGLRLRTTDQLELLPGDHLRVLARARAPAAPGWPTALRAAAATAEVTPGAWTPGRACAQLRRQLERALLRLVPGEHGPMLATLVLGRATRPDFALTAAHRATGLSHLLAVSGAHAAMLAFLLGLSSRGRRVGASPTHLWSVVGILAVYGGVAGAEPPVVRAVVAAVLAAVAARVGRPFGLASGLLAPALVTAATSPEQLTGPSFLLSYAAVIGLGVAARTSSAPGPFGALRRALRASFWATLLTTPFTLWFFEQLAPTTILLTPLCAPIVAALLMLGLVAASLAAVAPVLAEWLGPLLQLLAATYASIVYAADSLPWTPIPANGTPPAWLVGLAGVTAAGWIFARPRRRTIIGGVALVAALWFLPLAPAARPGLEVFAVGHGQAALLTDSAGAQSLIDCGSLQSGARAAKSVTAALPRRRLELLVITHDDADHHNGVAALLRRVRVTRAILPASMQATPVHQLLRAHAARVELLPAGETRRAGPLRISAPGVPAAASDNDRSLWVRASLRGVEVLLSGDAQEDGVAAAIQDGIAGRADLLLLPHHGRPNRNAPLLLAAVQPRACLVSAAATDGATALGVLARRFGAEVWTTGRHGDLRFDGAAVHAAQAPALLAPADRPR